MSLMMRMINGRKHLLLTIKYKNNKNNNNNKKQMSSGIIAMRTKMTVITK